MKSSDKGLLLATLLFCLGLTTSSQAKVCFLVGGCGTDVAGRPCQGAGCADPIPDGSKTCEKLGYTRTVEFCCKGVDNSVEKVKFGTQTEPAGDFHLITKDGTTQANGTASGNLYVDDIYNFFTGKSGIVKVGNNICSYIQDESGADNGSGTCDSGGTHYTRRCKCDPKLYRYVKPAETDYEIRNPSCTDEGVRGTIFGQHISGETHYMYKVCDPKAGTKVTKYPYTKDARGYTEINSNVLLVNTNAAVDYAHYRLVGNCDTHADGLNKEVHTKSYNETWDNTNKPTIYNDDKWIGVGNVDGSKGSCEEKYDLRPGEANVMRYAKCICPKDTYKYPNDDNVLKSTNSNITLKSHNIGGDKCRDSGTSHNTIDFYTDAACSGQNDVLGAGKINVSPITNGSWKKYEQNGYRCWYDVSKTGNYHLDGAINKVGGLECRVYFPRPCDEFKDGGKAMLEDPAKGYRVRYVNVKDGGSGNHSEDGVNCNKLCYSKAAGLCQVGDYINNVGLCANASSLSAAKTAFANAKVSQTVVGIVTDVNANANVTTLRVVALDDTSDSYQRFRSGSFSKADAYNVSFYNDKDGTHNQVSGSGKWGLITDLEVNSIIDHSLMSKLSIKNDRSNLFVMEISNADSRCQKGKYAYADVYKCYHVNYVSDVVDDAKIHFLGRDYSPEHDKTKISRAVIAYRDDDGDGQNDLSNDVASFSHKWGRFAYNAHIYLRKIKTNWGGSNQTYTFENPVYYNSGAECKSSNISMDQLIFTNSYGNNALGLNNYIPLSYGVNYFIQTTAAANAATSSDTGLTDMYGTSVWPKGVQPWRIAVAAGAEKTNSMQWGGACNYGGTFNSSEVQASGLNCHFRMYWDGQGYPSSVCNTSEWLTSNSSAEPTKRCFTENVTGDGGKHWSVRMAENCYIRWDYTHGNCWQTMRWSGDTNPCDSSKERCKIWPKKYSGWDNGWGPNHDDNGTAQPWDDNVSKFYQRGIQGCFTRAAVIIKIDATNNRLSLDSPGSLSVDDNVSSINDHEGFDSGISGDIFEMTTTELQKFKQDYVAANSLNGDFLGDKDFLDVIDEVIKLRGAVESAQAAVTNAKKVEANRKNTKDQAYSAYVAATKALENAKAACQAAGYWRGGAHNDCHSGQPDEGTAAYNTYWQLNNTYDAAEEAKDKAEDAYDDAKDAYDDAVDDREDAEKALNKANSEFEDYKEEITSDDD